MNFVNARNGPDRNWSWRYIKGAFITINNISYYSTRTYFAFLTYLATLLFRNTHVLDVPSILPSYQANLSLRSVETYYKILDTTKSRDAGKKIKNNYSQEYQCCGNLQGTDATI